MLTAIPFAWSSSILNGGLKLVLIEAVISKAGYPFALEETGEGWRAQEKAR